MNYSYQFQDVMMENKRQMTRHMVTKSMEANIKFSKQRQIVRTALPSAHCFTSLTQSSSCLSVTANWTLSDSRFSTWLRWVFMAYNDKDSWTIKQVRSKTATWNTHLKEHNEGHYLLISTSQGGGQIATLLPIPVHGHKRQHVSASWQKKLMLTWS